MTKEVGSDTSPLEILDHTMTLAATTTAPTKGTVVTDICKYWRYRQFLFMRWDYLQSAGGTAGSGVYLFPIPDDLTIDTDLIGTNNAEFTMGIVGPFLSEASTVRYTGNIHVYDSTRLYASGMNATTERAAIGASNSSLGAADRSMSFFASWIPIVEWS